MRPNWSQAVPQGPNSLNWFQMVSNSSKRSQIVLKGSKYYQKLLIFVLENIHMQVEICSPGGLLSGRRRKNKLRNIPNEYVN